MTDQSLRTAFGDLPEYMTRKQLAELAGVSVHLLARYAVEKPPGAPVMTKLGRNTVRYAKADAIAWLESRRVTS